MIGAAFYSTEPDQGRADEGVPYLVGDGAGAYPYAPPTRYAVAGDGGLVDAEIRSVEQLDAGEPGAFTMISEMFNRLVALSNTASNVIGLDTIYEPGTREVPTPDPGGMIAYGPSIRETRDGAQADHSRPTFNVALNRRLIGLPWGWHGVSGGSEAPRVEANRHYGAQQPMGVWGRVTTWPKAVQRFIQFGQGDQ